MNVIQVIRKFKNNEACIKMLESIRWANGITCAYCNSDKVTVKKENNRSSRHQCHSCNKSFTVLVGTIFHKVRKLPEWFGVLAIMLNAQKSASTYQIARDIGMRQASVWDIMTKIRKAMESGESELLKGIVEMDETYVGGKSKGISKRGRGTDKTPVIGIVERGGKVVAKAMNKTRLTYKELSGFLETKVDLIKSHLMTDEYRGYAPISSIIEHSVINHSQTYVLGDVHTNTIEGFWSLLKRAWYGSHHHWSKENTYLYVAETCYKYNNRKNDNVFIDTLKRMIGKGL